MDQRALSSEHPRKGLYGVRYGWWAIICLVYVLSPIDLAPELVLGPVGIIDDAGIAAFGVYNLVQWIRAWRRERAAGTLDSRG